MDKNERLERTEKFLALLERISTDLRDTCQKQVTRGEDLETVLGALTMESVVGMMAYHLDHDNVSQVEVHKKALMIVGMVESEIVKWNKELLEDN